MDFSEALELVVHTGGKISREGWNGRGMYVVHQKGYPDGISINGNTAQATGIPEGTVCVFRPYLMFRTVDGEFVPWVASQTDLLATDWAWTNEADDEPGQVEPEPEIGVYSERARLIAYLATQHRAVIAYNDPAEPDWPVIYIDTQLGQLSWHLAADDLPLFPHVPVAGPGDELPEWDGHDTPEKYRRLDVLVRLVAENRGLI